jgi:hypothetical protein
MKNKFIYILLVSFLFGTKLHAQSVKLSTGIDTNKAMIGDQVHYKIEIERTANEKIIWPQLPDSIGKLEFISHSKIDTIPQKNSPVITEILTYTITSFDTGNYVIPSFKFTYTRGKDTAHFVLESPQALLSVFAPKVDTTAAIKEIKDPLGVPYTFKEMLPYIIGGLILIAIIIGIIYYLRRRNQGKPIFSPSIPARPAHEIALDALYKLEKEKAWQQGNVKYYHTIITDTIRTYIESRFGIGAMELTTDETMLHFRGNILTNEQKEKLNQLLRLSDLVKFAKVQPLPNENELSLKNAYDFINFTIVNVVAAEEPNQPVS